MIKIFNNKSSTKNIETKYMNIHFIIGKCNENFLPYNGKKIIIK